MTARAKELIKAAWARFIYDLPMGIVALVMLALLICQMAVA